CLFSSCVRAPSSKVLSLAPAVGLPLVTAETTSARPKKHHAERPVAPRVDRFVLLTVPSPERAVAAAPACLACLQALADQQRGRPRSPVACARLRSMRASATTPPSRLLRALLA